MDAPASIHARKLIPWVIIQGLLIAAGAARHLMLSSHLGLYLAAIAWLLPVLRSRSPAHSIHQRTKQRIWHGYHLWKSLVRTLTVFGFK